MRATREHPDPTASGWLYGLNTLGAVAGALVAALGLLPELGFAPTAWAVGAGVLVLSLGLRDGPRRLATAVAGVAALGVALFTTSSPGRHRMQGAPDLGGSRVVALDEGPDFTTSVIQLAEGTRVL